MNSNLPWELEEIGYTPEEAKEVDNLLIEGKLPKFVKENIGYIIESGNEPYGFYPRISVMYDVLSDILTDPAYLCKETITHLRKGRYDLSIYHSTPDTTANEIIAGVLLSTCKKRLAEGKFSFRRSWPKPSFL